MTTSFFGLVGTNGAGKTEACTYFEKQGYRAVSLSDEVRREAAKLKRPLNRDSLVQTANELKAKFGSDILAKRTVEMVQKLGVEKVVFDSIRHIDEIQILKKIGTRIIGINAPIQLRYERIKSRNRETDSIDFQTFIVHDRRENEGHSSGQNIYACIKECEIVLENNGSAEELYTKLAKYLKIQSNTK